MAQVIENISSNFSNIESIVLIGQKNHIFKIKNCFISNETNSNAKVSLYTKKNNNINYLIRNLIIPPKSTHKFEREFYVNYGETLYAINLYSQELSILCNYISDIRALKYIKPPDIVEPPPVPDEPPIPDEPPPVPDEPPAPPEPIVEKAKIKVNITPSSVLGYSPQWCIDYGYATSEWLDPGIEYEIDPGTYSINFKDIDTWTKPTAYSYYFEKDKTTVITGVYYRDKTGTFNITFKIPTEYENYLNWCVIRDDYVTDQVIIDWNNSLTYSKDLPVGNYVLKIQQIDKIDVDGKYIYDYEKDEYRLDNIFFKGEETRFNLETIKTFNYDLTNIKNTTKICVNIQPEKLRSLTKWYLTAEESSKNNSTAFESGQTIEIPFGNFYITSDSLSGWYVKNSELITASSETDLILYDLEYYVYSSLRIKFTNNKTVAKWRIVGTETWYSDNEEVLLYPDSYEVEFSEITNFEKINNIYFNLIKEQVNVSTVSYIPYGSLKVTIASITEPPEHTEIIGTPQWKVKDTTDWKNSGDTVYLAAGTYIIQFNTVGNIFTYKDTEVTIVSNELTEKEITFVGVYLLSTPTKSSFFTHVLNKYQKADIFETSIVPTEINQVKFSYDGLMLVLCHNTTPYLTLFNCVDFILLDIYDIVKPTSGVRSCAFSHNNKYLVVSHNEHPYLTIYNTTDWNQVSITNIPATYCNTICFSNNDEYLVLGFDTSPFIKIYSVNLNFSEIVTTNINITNEILCCEFSSDDLLLGISTHKGNGVYIIETATWTQLNTVFSDLRETIYSILFTNSYIIACSNYYFYLYYYDKNTYEKLNIVSDLPMGINTHMTLSGKDLIIGNTNSPYLIIYNTDTWSKVTIETSELDYCKKFDVSCDLSTRSYIKTPVNTYPKDNYRGLRSFEALTSSAFDVYNLSDTHLRSRWRLFDNTGILVYDSGESTDLTSHLLPSTFFDTPAVFSWQVRYKGSSGIWSFWSQKTYFSTIYSYIAKPTNTTPINGSINQNVNPTLTSSAFSCVNYADTHVYSQWKLYQKINTEWVQIYDTHGITAALSYSVPYGILSGKTSDNVPEYGWSVRYKGQVLDWSDWSDITSFSTDVCGVTTPTNISPNGDINVVESNVLLKASTFATTGYVDTLTNVEFRIFYSSQEIYNSGQIEYTDMTSNVEYQVPVGVLEDGQKVYSWNCRYKGKTLGWSEWSTQTSFTTRVDQVSKVIVNISPSLLDPVTGLSLLKWKWRKSDQISGSDYIQPGVETTIDSGQQIIIEFNNYSGYVSPASITVSLVVGITYTYNVTYERAKGSLTYNITPSSGQWKRTNSSSWYNSGQTETDVYYGTYDIQFSSVQGYKTPAIDQNVVINGNVTRTKTYDLEDPYYVKVILNTGFWRINNGEWLQSGVTTNVNNYASNLIEFQAIDGYTAPESVSFYCPDDYSKYSDPTTSNKFLFSAVYINNSITGGLVVTTEPNTAKWKLTTETYWHNSGDYIEVNEGAHVVEFEEISNYDKPNDLSVLIVKLQTTYQSGIYTEKTSVQTKDLIVKISPLTVANNTQTKYRVRYSVRRVNNNFNTESWTNWIQYFKSESNGVYYYNDNVIHSLKTGYYEIEFSEVDGYTKPENKIINVVDTGDTEDIVVSCNYGGGQTTTSYGNINLTILTHDPNGKRITTPQELLDKLQFKHTTVTLETEIPAIAKDLNNSSWGSWISYSNFSSISKNLDTSKIHLYQVNPISSYFNTSGNVFYVQFSSSTETKDVYLGFIQYNVTKIIFELILYAYDKDVANNVGDITIPITVKTAQAQYSPYYANVFKTLQVQIPGSSLTYRGGGDLPVPVLQSREYTLQELFGSNHMGSYIIAYFGSNEGTFLSDSGLYRYYIKNQYFSPTNVILAAGGTTLGYHEPLLSYYDPNVYYELGPVEAGGSIDVYYKSGSTWVLFNTVNSPAGYLLPSFPNAPQGTYKLVFKRTNTNYKNIDDFLFNYNWLDYTEPNNFSYLFNFTHI